MRQEDQSRAQKLAFVNSVSENAYSNEIVARELLELLAKQYPDIVKAYYNLKDEDDITLENISNSRNWIKTGGEADLERTAIYVLRDFRDGKTGRFVLDELD